MAGEVRRLAGPDFTPATPLALAVSGGADSLALLWLAARAFGARAQVLTVDHGLRAEAAGECAMVESVAAAQGLEATRLTLAPPPNGQEAARLARYSAMAGVCRAKGIGHLLTAHHLDDQAETLLMRLARGSGLSGLAAIRPVSAFDGLLLLRPLLGHGRGDLRAIVEAAGWRPADDPSNRDPRYDRTHARALLAQTPWLEAERLAASAAHLADAEAAMLWIDERLWEGRSGEAGGRLWLDPEALPPYLRRRLLARAFRALEAPAPDGPALTRLLQRLEAGAGGTLGGLRVRAAAGRWWLSAAPPPRRG
nr:tRNA lysidine(34) synthetase TilS [Sandaracinobacteroides sayramensis]